MNYELKSSIKRNRNSLPIKVIVVIVVLLFIINLLMPSLISNFLYTIIKPFWNVGRGNTPDAYTLMPEAQSEIISQLKKENIELKSLLNRKDANNLVLGYILKKPPYTVYDSYIIDIGTKNGVKVGDKVYAGGNILVGDISEVYTTTSKVRLFSGNGNKYDVLLGDKNIQASAEGGGGGTFIVSVPRDTKIYEGDIVTIPDISSTVFGRINKIIIDPARPFATVIFSQPINLYEQKWVLVELNKSNE